MPKIAVIPGDGVGVEVIAEAVKVLKEVDRLDHLGLELVRFDFGAERYLKTGEAMPPGQIDEFRNHYDAILLGALGDPRIPDMAHGRAILLACRFELDLYINMRPVKLIHEKLCPIKNKGPEQVNFVVFRENTEGPYVGAGGFLKKNTPDEVAVQQSIHTRKGVERIIRAAFEYARKHGLPKVTMADKSNVLRYGHDLWQRTFREVGEAFPEIEKEHYYVDALVMEMVRQPEKFHVIVTENMLGDIITDLGAMLQGGMGMAASGNIHPGKVSLFEPVHGSAPPIAGKNIANPLAAILSAAMMLEHLGLHTSAQRIERAVVQAVMQDVVTEDLGGRYGTREVGDFVASHL
ncbi:MAG: 3-isopropylmalate dehydrogenase [candidate division KSB1 bacterium]|nr:3-isopropylmalate dehydrogenase [candidate division KSB1 bacterium]